MMLRSLASHRADWFSLSCDVRWSGCFKRGMLWYIILYSCFVLCFSINFVIKKVVSLSSVCFYVCAPLELFSGGIYLWDLLVL